MNKKARSVAGMWLRAIVVIPTIAATDGTMANFIVTYRLQDGTGYQDRYESLMEQLAKVTHDGAWEETSSFVAFTSSKSLDEIHEMLYVKSLLSPSMDALVIIDLTNRAKRASGKIEYPNTLTACLGF